MQPVYLSKEVRKIKEDNHIGEQHGIYTIQNLLNYKDKYKHKIYQDKCIICGFEKKGTYQDFKKEIKQCKHFSKLSEENINIWFDNNKKFCLNCGKQIELDLKNIKSYTKKKFCCQACAAIYNNTHKNKKVRFCINCGKQLLITSKKFCSVQCQKDFYYNDYIKKWKNGDIDVSSGYGISKRIRNYIFEKYNYKCSKCGWKEINKYSGAIPLEIHHKDGDYKNNSEDNLELLCPNCHSLTKNYKGLNIGHGRKDR